MLRGRDVPEVMSKVEAVLSRAGRSPGGARGVLYVTPDDPRDLASSRHLANLDVEFASGSDRPLIGPAVRFAKRAVRRGLRWYVGPIAAQQTRFNHVTLDLIEKLRSENEWLRAELEALRAGGSTAPPDPPG
jgi:hypothetical protein